MSKCLIAPQTLANDEGPFLQVLREAGFELVYPDKPLQMTEDELLAKLQGINASLAGSEPYTRKVLEANPQLRVIARAGVGFDAVDVAAATERGVAVTICPGTNQDAVAEHTFTLILALAKGLIGQHQATKEGKWPRGATIPLRGRTLGIIGLGRIGKAVALRGIAFGMPILAYEPIPDQAFVAQHGITLTTLDKVLATGDYVSLHVPLTQESKYLINKRTLGLMKPTSFLINTARGPLVNEADLHAALKAGKIAGAGLDVFEQEPPGKLPLFELDNVVLTPHAAGVDLQSKDDMALASAQSIVALAAGGWPAPQIVNPEVRSRFKW
jgi:D-3-phosphoglycerate dehydrogenase / 2-oxoglutarate reductase